MSGHGNYRTITHHDAYRAAQDFDCTLVSLDEVVYQKDVSLHVVAPHDFYTHDVPPAFTVQLYRPHHLYGSEGMLSPALQFLGRLEDGYCDAYESDWWPGDENDPFPYNGDFLWLLPNRWYNPNTKEFESVPWCEVDWSWWETLVNPSAREVKS